jgi:tryptophan-rich sensory protein
MTLAKTGAAVLATGVVGGLASRPAQSAWFAKLRKPSFQPPRQVFPIVWPLLYADIAVVSAGAIDDLNEQGRSDEAKTYSALLALNLILNAGWSWLFFDRRRIGTSAIAAAALAASSADLTRRAVGVSGAPAGVLGLYPMWCAFATLLSTRIWWLNR